jgi:hypothetical protein
MFNGVYWPRSKHLHQIWLGLLDYGRGEWNRWCRKPGGSLKFSSQWYKNSVLAQMSGGKPHWHLTGLMSSFV